MLKSRSSSLVLTFHRLVEEHNEAYVADESTTFYNVDVATFRRVLSTIERLKLPAVTMDELLERTTARARRVTITFDDGHESDISLALPLLQEYGVRATFFLCVDFIGKPGYLSWSQVEALARAGMSIQSHGLIHHPLTRVAEEQLLVELSTSRLYLQSHVGRPVSYLAVPGGFVNRTVTAAAFDAGYKAVCTSCPGTWNNGNIVKRIAIRQSTSPADIDGLLSFRPYSLGKPYLLYRTAHVVKKCIGLRAYQTIKGLAGRSISATG
jgi:peptidoglycan/xylan/chitin deacetylase (PgdA/CDA1 family)